MAFESCFLDTRRFSHSLRHWNEAEEKVLILEFVFNTNVFTTKDFLVQFSNQMNTFSPRSDEFESHECVHHLSSNETLWKHAEHVPPILHFHVFLYDLHLIQ